jgi:hypothetical protein
MSADNAIAVLRTRKGKGFEYRLAEYGVSAEPFDRATPTSVSIAKGIDYQPDDETVVLDGFVLIKPHDAQHFAEMFARSPVLGSEAEAMKAAATLEEEIGYVEYGSERVCLDGTWAELMQQSAELKRRRKTCKVHGPNCKPDYVRNFARQDDFKCLGGPGIEDKLRGWGWSDELVAGVMKLVHEEFFAWKKWKHANNLRISRIGDRKEALRYGRTKAAGCCQKVDKVYVVDTDEGEVRVRFGFNHGH